MIVYFHVTFLIEDLLAFYNTEQLEMLLRPYYPLSSSNGLYMAEVPADQLIQLLLNLSKPARHSLLKYLDIRQLIVFLRAIAKNEAKDELYEYTDVSLSLQKFWIDLIEAINDFSCLKLVNQYSTPGDISELSINSEEYEFLLEYVLDISSTEVKICFKLIDIHTTKFNKIFKMLEKHSYGLQISNDRLSVIKDSDSLKSKLLVLDLCTYENFEIAKKMKIETLNVIGNEIDNFTISKLMSNNKNLKYINFKNRNKDLVPLPDADGITIRYDIAIYDTFDKASLCKLGSLDQINELFLNFTMETDITFDWLKNCQLLKKLYFALNYETTRVENISAVGEFSHLEHLVLKRCELSSTNNLSHFMMPNLKTISLVDCAFDISFLGQLNYLNLLNIKLINCDIVYDDFIKLPRNLQTLTIINEEIEEVKDMVFLTVQTRKESHINPYRRINLNINDFVMTLNPLDSHDIYLCKNGFGNINTSQLKPIENSKLLVSIFPHFNWFNLSVLNEFLVVYKISKIVVELYSLSNQYQKFNEIEFVARIEKQKYDIYELIEYLQQILTKKELNERDKKFLINWQYVPRHPREGKNSKLALKRQLTHSKFEKEEKTDKKKKRGRKSNKERIELARLQTIDEAKSLPYLCNVCDKSFARSTALNRHSLIHRDTRPFACEDCGYCFKRADHLKVHKRVCLRLSNQ